MDAQNHGDLCLGSSAVHLDEEFLVPRPLNGLDKVDQMDVSGFTHGERGCGYQVGSPYRREPFSSST